MIIEKKRAMTDVFVECKVETSLDGQALRQLTDEVAECRDLYRVRFEESFSEREGGRLICHFRAPDAESVRMALRCSGADIGLVWAGSIHKRLRQSRVNVVVEHRLSSSPKMEASALVDDIATDWFDRYGFRLARAIVSRDCTRMIGLYEAPDTESIRLGGKQGHLPVTSFWVCQ